MLLGHLSWGTSFPQRFMAWERHRPKLGRWGLWSEAGVTREEANALSPTLHHLRRGSDSSGLASSQAGDGGQATL